MRKAVFIGLGLMMAMPVVAGAQQSIETQCRAEVRAQMRGPECRRSGEQDPNSPCYIRTGTDFPQRVAACINAGGPTKWLARGGR